MVKILRAQVEKQERPLYLQPVDQDGNYPWKKSEDESASSPKDAPGPSQQAGGSDGRAGQSGRASQVGRKRKTTGGGNTGKKKTATPARQSTKVNSLENDSKIVSL